MARVLRRFLPQKARRNNNGWSGTAVWKQKRLKKQLGSKYFFEQRISAAVVKNMLAMVNGSNHFLTVASLTVGIVKLEAILYWYNGKYSLGYDVMVRDSPECPEWSCYESLQEEVRYNAWNLEREMFLVLDRAVTRLGLSYTEYVFPKLYGARS